MSLGSSHYYCQQLDAKRSLWHTQCKKVQLNSGGSRGVRRDFRLLLLLLRALLSPDSAIVREEE